MLFPTCDLLDAVDAHLVLVDPEDRILWANRAYRGGRDPSGRTWRPTEGLHWTRASLDDGSALLTGVAAVLQVREEGRAAGRAEIAASVLHHVGNALNSVYVAIGSTRQRLWSARMASVSRTARLLVRHREELVRFLTEDPRGGTLPAYLDKLGDHLEQERRELSQQLEALERSVDEIREIVRGHEILTDDGRSYPSRVW